MAKRKKSKPPILAIAVTAIVVVLLMVFVPKLVHKCDDCGKVFFGTGYEPNVVSDFLAEDDQTICRECAEEQHMITSAFGKSLDDFKKPLF